MAVERNGRRWQINRGLDRLAGLVCDPLLAGLVPVKFALMQYSVIRVHGRCCRLGELTTLCCQG